MRITGGRYSCGAALAAVGIAQGNQNPKNEDQPNHKASHDFTSFIETGVYGNLRKAIFVPWRNARFLLKTTIKSGSRQLPSRAVNEYFFAIHQTF
jgi:hypothetical protein